MRYQAWMNDRIDEQNAHPTRVDYQPIVGIFPILAWYAVSVGIVFCVLYL